jgi:ArsR family transcriptional regulator, cadmium/lead-responsive transcriptional repressor
VNPRTDARELNWSVSGGEQDGEIHTAAIHRLDEPRPVQLGFQVTVRVDEHAATLRMGISSAADASATNLGLDTIHLRLYSLAVAVSSLAFDLATLGRVGTALADPTRRRILVDLIDGPGYPAEFAERFGTTRANLSNHLTCLRRCGLVTATAEGRRVRYELADPRLAEALHALATLDLPGHCDT